VFAGAEVARHFASNLGKNMTEKNIARAVRRDEPRRHMRAFVVRTPLSFLLFI
jgi:hypothetical protein